MPKEADPNCDGDSSSTDEGDNNKSFVKKVKSHVTGFLPSSLSKWLGSKSRQRDELGDEDDTYELQPPPKRAKTHNLDFKLTNIPNNRNAFREPVAGPSSIATRKLVQPTSNHYNQNQADQTNGVDSDSGESTSGYSSMPRIGSKEQVSDLPGHSNGQQNHVNSTIVGNKSIFNTSIPLERSLFGENLTSPKKSNSTLSSRQPSFNVSAFGAPNFMDKTLSTRRIFNSPFYSGRITYGGASAYSRNVLQSSPEQPYQNRTVQPKLVNENKSAALSKTAKRILDTLEQYTSPAQDVRRIPTDQRRTPRPEGLIGKYIGANPYTVRETTKLPSQRELQVPTMSDLLKMKLKERLQDSTSSVREMANHSNSSLNAEEEYSFRNTQDDKLSSNKSTNKIKTKVSSVRQRAQPADEIVPEVKLPDVQLPISTLPSFNFSIPFGKPDPPKKPLEQKETSSFNKTKNFFSNTPTSSIDSTVKTPASASSFSKTVTTPTINFKNPEVKLTPFAPVPPPPVINKVPALPKVSTILQESKQLQKDINEEYRFSKPLVIAENKFKSIKAINNFRFSEPVVKKVLNGLPQIKKVADVPVTSTSPKSGFGDMFKLGADKWECSVCMVRNTSSATSCISCTTPKTPAKPTSNGPSKTTITGASSWGDKFKAPSNNWTCSVCMISNDSSKEKCVACENPKTKPTSAITSVNTKASGFEGFTKKTDEWQCPSCMVNNANAKEKCVCCETPKPSTKSTTTPAKPPITSSWGDKFKVPPTTWECSMCLIRNNVDKEKCAACENPRPAGIAGATPKGIDGFKKKESEWECSSCMVPNPSSKEKCVCCEAPKPGSKPVTTAQVKEVPKFSFGIENGLINGQGFMFGIPADKNVKTNEKKVESLGDKTTSSDSTSTQFLFGIPPPNGAKTTLPSKSSTADLSSVVKPSAEAPAFSFGTSTGFKRPASNDEADTVGSSKKADSGIAFPINPTVNGSLENVQTTKADAPKLTFGVNNGPISSSSPISIVKPTENKSSVPAPAFGASTTTSTPMFSFNAAPTLPAPLKSDAIAEASTPTLGTKQNAEKPLAAEPAGSLFKFNSAPTTSASVAPSMFNTGSVTTNGSTPTFSFSAKAPAKPEGVAPTFSFGNPGGTTAVFGASANSTNTFGSTTQPPAPAPTFGTGLGFGGSNGPAGTFGTSKVDPPTFGSPAPPTFGASASTFGKPTTNGVFNFGTAANPISEVKPAFNFGASATTASGSFSFGASASAQNTNGAFNFGGTETPKPTFNFTAGSGAPTAFSAQPSEAKSNRVIRRAIRRTQR